MTYIKFGDSYTIRQIFWLYDNVAYGMYYMVCIIWYVVYGMYYMVCIIWYVVYGMHCIKS